MVLQNVVPVSRNHASRLQSGRNHASRQNSVLLQLDRLLTDQNQQVIFASRNHAGRLYAGRYETGLLPAG